jgi:hypothetical protein
VEGVAVPRGHADLVIVRLLCWDIAPAIDLIGIANLVATEGLIA